jgi:hypothetical protein
VVGAEVKCVKSNVKCEEWVQVGDVAERGRGDRVWEKTKPREVIPGASSCACCVIG